jgi:electron transfer flavoprotein alpha subunit
MTQDSQVLVLAEVFGGVISPHTHEMFTAGKIIGEGLGTGFTLALMGTYQEDALENIGDLDASIKVISATVDEDDVTYPYEAWADVAAQLVDQEQPRVVIAPGSAFGSEYGPRLAARLGLPMASYVTSVGVDDGGVIVTRDVLGGRAETAIRCDPDTRMVIALEPGMISPSAIGNVDAISLQDVFAELAPSTTVVSAGPPRRQLAGAERIVSGGRGMQSADGVALMEKLADVLDAAVGSSGAAVVMGLSPHETQVGSSGTVVTPKLYLAAGISGTPQHTFGMRDSQFIVAINSDPNAAIFQIADFGIVGDLFEVVPALIAALQAPA